MLKFAKFIGANTDFSTAQAYLFPRVFPDDFSEPVFGLVVSGEGEDIFIHVRQKILNLEEQFSAPFERVTEKLHQLSEVLKEELLKVENLKFTLFCAKENVFYVLQFGGNIVEIFREGRAMPIVEGENLQEKVVSGFLQSGDRVLVLSSKPGEGQWSEGVLEQVWNLPLNSIDDAEVIFASSELKSDNQEDLAGVKNIEAVAFILVENRDREGTTGTTSTTSTTGGKVEGEGEALPFPVPKVRINFKVKMPSFNLWIFLHKFSRRLFGVLRQLNRKLLMGMGVLLLVLVVSGGGYLFFKGRVLQKNQRFENLTASVEASLNEAAALKDSDSKLAGEKIVQAKARLGEAEGLQKENPRIGELKVKVDEKEGEVLHIYKNVNLDLFISLDLIKNTFKTERMSFSVGKILVLDTADKSLVSIDTELKTPSILAGPVQLGNGQLASLNGSHAFVYSPGKGIVHVDIDTKKVSSVTNADPEWGEVKDMFAFSGNVYVLDIGNPPVGGQIWKYAPTESGYSGRQEYLRSEADLGLGKKLVIDYSVWVLTSEPGILKFTGGGEDYYAPSGLQKPLAQIDNIYVPEELDSVFILDKSEKRILVTKKNGEYLAQYFSEQLGKVDDFFVDEEQKAIYLLIENKIFKTPLR